ncbi:MAG: flagellar hook-basal body complex protein [Phycisphaerales bacterium]|jgi:flagellar hook protein FlgE|nr:flagellar hook-basal body complex protein [Phycisphaerales bacterium]
MALTSTLFTGLSGLDVNQTRLNVVGNNIANVNTVGFKSSRALFRPQFYVTDSGGSPPSSEFGGTNPSQRGLGATVAAIEKDFSPGSIEPTGKLTDLAIDGQGFFVVKSNTQKYTRDGSFQLNSSNQIVNTNGDFLQGFGVDSDFNIIPGQLQNVTIPLGAMTAAQATENVKLEGNLNADGAVASGASVLNSQSLTTLGGLAAPDATTLLTNIADSSTNAVPKFAAGDVLTLQGKKGGRDLPSSTYTVTAGSTLGDLQSFLQNGLGIETGVVASPTPGVTLTTTGTDVTLDVTGNMGAENSLSLAGAALTSSSGVTPFTFTDSPTSNPTGESVQTSFVAYDSLGTPITVSVTSVLESKADTGNTWRFYASSGDNTGGTIGLGTGTLTFDNNGKLLTSTGSTISIDRQGTGAKTPLAMKLDFGEMTSLTSRNSELVMTEQDGSAIGTLNNFSIGANGMITGSFSNGLTRNLGQVAMATFNNPLGLVDNGGNMYSSGANSGVPIISAPLSLGAGSIRSGALELSNVDLSKEFINLIIASTGFTASSRVISTSDQLLTELLNSSR